MEAVVMAAGEGRRLRPVTERWPKPVLPIDGRPVLATLLRELASAGVERVWLVTGHLATQIEQLAGDGGAFGLEVIPVRQPDPLGSADAVARALAAGAALPVLVSAADTVFHLGDVDAFQARVVASDADGGVAVRRDPPPSAARRAVRIRAGLVERVQDDDPDNPLSGAPLWVLGGAVVDHLCRDREPFERGNAVQAAIDNGARVVGVEIGKTRDLTNAFDLVRENFHYLASTSP
jgi:NDP-sugar pyrophosphorylase family protein